MSASQWTGSSQRHSLIMHLQTREFSMKGILAAHEKLGAVLTYYVGEAED
jgi:hypothetical protein